MQCKSGSIPTLHTPPMVGELLVPLSACILLDRPGWAGVLAWGGASVSSLDRSPACVIPSTPTPEVPQQISICVLIAATVSSSRPSRLGLLVFTVGRAWTDLLSLPVSLLLSS